MEARSKFLDPSKVPLKGRGDGNVWVTLTQLTQMMVFAAVVFCVVLCFVPELKKLASYQKQFAAEQQKRKEALALNAELTQVRDYLKNNTAYQERTARDKLNLGRPGETIFRFDPYPTGAVAANDGRAGAK